MTRRRGNRLASSAPVTVVNVLIIISLLAGLGAMGAIGWTAVQTATNVKVGTLTSQTTGGATQVEVPVTVTNNGILSISDISVQATAKDSAGSTLATGTVGPVSFAPG